MNFLPGERVKEGVAEAVGRRKSVCMGGIQKEGEVHFSSYEDIFPSYRVFLYLDPERTLYFSIERIVCKILFPLFRREGDANYLLKLDFTENDRPIFHGTE